jgi:hypothetical protein
LATTLTDRPLPKDSSGPTTDIHFVEWDDGWQIEESDFGG